MLQFIGYVFAQGPLLWAVGIIVGYVVLAFVVAGVWALVDVNARTRSKPYMRPKVRFQSVWKAALSPVDPKDWLTADNPIDPKQLPGAITGDLRVEDRGIKHVDDPGPTERLKVRMRLHNHGSNKIQLSDSGQVHLQLWTPDGKSVGRGPRWSITTLKPGYSADIAVMLRMVDRQPVGSWTVVHLPDGEYLTFVTADQPDQPA